MFYCLFGVMCEIQSQSLSKQWACPLAIDMKNLERLIRTCHMHRVSVLLMEIGSSKGQLPKRERKAKAEHERGWRAGAQKNRDSRRCHTH